jgi:hypothetical protein
MTAPVETMRFELGLHADIHHDPDAEIPYLDDDAVRIVVLHRRYVDPAGGACGRTPDEVAQWEHRHRREWFTIPLFLYDHSGTVYRVGWSNPFHCPWDSGRVGLVALRRERWGNGRPANDELETCAAAVAKEYSCWANGDCYGYVLRDVVGNELASCWGFIGLASVTAKARAAAHAHLTANALPRSST